MVREVAAKAAENVSRLAALFHVLEHGPAGTIGADHLLGAEAIFRWHLHEARRLLAELDTPPAPARLGQGSQEEVGRGDAGGCRFAASRLTRSGRILIREKRVQGNWVARQSVAALAWRGLDPGCVCNSPPMISPTRC